MNEWKVVAAIDLQTFTMALASLAATTQKANSDLLEAVKAGDESKVVAALAQPGVDVNCCEGEGFRRTPLLLACNAAREKKNVGVVRLLLEDCRVNVTARDRHGLTALHTFTDRMFFEEILLSKRTDIDWNAADMIGQTPLLLYARIGAEESVRRLIGVESVNLFAKTIDLFTALHQVAERETPYPDGMTLGDISCRCNIVDLVLEAVGRTGGNVVSFVDATEILNRSALHYIAEEGCIEILELLCKFSPNMNVNGVDFHGFTPLHLAVRNGHDAVVERLLELQSIDANVGATVNASNPDKLKPFEKQQSQICRPNLFLKTPEDQPTRDLTPLHFAAMDGRMKVVRLLLEWEGINIDAVDSAGLTPLHYSVQNGYSEVVELLLKKGKPFATLDYDRQCAVFEDLLHLATKREEKTIAKIIAIQLLNTLGSRMNDFADISTKFPGNQSLSDQSRLLQ
jgi:ankyrin repeat protein